MAEQERSGFTPPAVGGSSLLVVFAVLCLTVFALLSLATVRADRRLSDASAQAVQDYYAADCAAQEILARLRSGESPEGVTFWGGDMLHAGYACPISDTQELQVEVLLDGIGEDYVILRWQAAPIGTVEYDDSLHLWDGGPVS